LTKAIGYNVGWNLSNYTYLTNFIFNNYLSYYHYLLLSFSRHCFYYIIRYHQSGLTIVSLKCHYLLTYFLNALACSLISFMIPNLALCRIVSNVVSLNSYNMQWVLVLVVTLSSQAKSKSTFIRLKLRTLNV